MKKYLSLFDRLCRIGLGAMFVWSSLYKIQDPALFAQAVDKYQMLPLWPIGFFALTLPMAELLCGLMFILTKWVREAALITVVMMCMFIIALTQAAVRGLQIDCGCFAAGSGGKWEVLVALGRDILLLIPSLWLIFRPNEWLWQMRRSKTVAALLLLTLAFPANALVFSEAPQRGVWTTEHARAQQVAKETATPLVTVYTNKGCPFCKRLEAVLESRLFHNWQKDRGVLLAYVLYNEQDEAHRKQLDELGAFPHIVIEWQAPNGTNLLEKFTARRGNMPTQKHDFLAMEVVSAIDGKLAPWLAGKAQKSAEELLIADAKTVQVRSKGLSLPNLGVSLSSPDGKITEGAKIYANAKKRQENKVFTFWTGPDGREAGRETKLALNDTCQSGVYTAHYADPAKIAEAHFLQNSTFFRAMVGHPMQIQLNAAGLDAGAKLSVRQLPPGLSLDKTTGLVSGIPKQAGTFRLNATLAAPGTKRHKEDRLSAVVQVLSPYRLEKLPRMEHSILEPAWTSAGAVEFGNCTKTLRSLNKRTVVPTVVVAGNERMYSIGGTGTRAQLSVTLNSSGELPQGWLSGTLLGGKEYSFQTERTVDGNYAIAIKDGDGNIFRLRAKSTPGKPVRVSGELPDGSELSLLWTRPLAE